MTSGSAEEWVRPGPTARQRRRDLWVGLTVAGLALFNLFLARQGDILASDDAPIAAEQTGWALAATLPLIWRRRQPEIVALCIAAVFIGGQVRASQEQQVATAALCTAIYTVGAWSRLPRRGRIVRWVIIGSMFAWYGAAWVVTYDMVPPEQLPFRVLNGVITNGMIFGFAYLLGEVAGQDARRRHQLESQAAELRAAQALAAERAVLGERVRIARELHDVVAHHVSVMGIQASACRRALDKDPSRARTALAAIEEGARTAVDELRRMLGALRTSGEPILAGAGLDRVGELAERAREAGLTVHFAVYGDPVPIPESISQAAYRIIQEAVTNTLKHAHAGTLDVRVRYLARELEVDIADDGRGGEPSGGMGLIGMRERVAVHGGTLEIGPRSGGGFRVRARLPYAHELVAA